MVAGVSCRWQKAGDVWWLAARTDAWSRGIIWLVGISWASAGASAGDDGLGGHWSRALTNAGRLLKAECQLLVGHHAHYAADGWLIELRPRLSRRSHAPQKQRVPFLAQLHQECRGLSIDTEHQPVIEAKCGTAETVWAGVTIATIIAVTVTATVVQRSIFSSYFTYSNTFSTRF